MIQCEGFTAQAIYVGVDTQLGVQLREGLEEKGGWSLHQVVDVDTALALQSQYSTCVAILCVSDDLSHAQAIRFLRSVDRAETPTIVVYDQSDSTELLELFRLGVAECLARPINVSRLFLVMDMLTAAARVAAKTKPLPAAGDAEAGAAEAGAAEPATMDWHGQLMHQVRTVAGLNTTVLITGETGTGKTRLSRLIHGMSQRKDRPFLAVNCGALSESLLDSELFGHLKGAFTGADRDYAGKLSQCADGTLLLDEVDMLTPAAQAKLLQVVEERVFQPVGSAKFEPLKARLIVASNRTLEHEVAAGRFRADLFYRLNVMSFELPPLRKRSQEIRQLAMRFSTEFAQHHGFNASPLQPCALNALESYAWPGNIRELRNVMERAVILSSGGAIEALHLPAHVERAVNALPHRVDVERPATGNKLADARFEAERELLLNALRRNDNNRSKTALDLGISRVALYKRLRKLQIT